LLSGASGQLRNVATTAGNLLQRTRCAYFRDLASACNKRDPGAGCDAIGGFHRMHAILGTSDACIATHPSDMAVAMLAYDAVVRVRGRDGDRDIPLSVFYRLPGSRPDCENALAPGDLITSVLLPPTRSGERAVYLKLRDRASYEFALASAAVVLAMDGERISAARFALGGVGTKPWRVPAAEAALAGRAPSEALFEEAASIALTGARPLPQNAFKVELARRCLRQAFRNALS
jgi:xanthine dehydrogenase YagS FAD-binding subunit